MVGTGDGEGGEGEEGRRERRVNKAEEDKPSCFGKNVFLE